MKILQFQYISAELGRKAANFTSHHMLKISLWFCYFKQLKELCTIYDEGEMCDSVQHAGTEILPFICGRRSRYQEPSENVDSIRQTKMPVLVDYFEHLAFLK